MSRYIAKSSATLEKGGCAVSNGAVCPVEARGEAAAWERHPFGSNAVRLTGRQWLVTLGILVALYAGLPRVSSLLEHFESGQSYRIPYDLSNDYWLYGRCAQEVVKAGRIAVVGDSVIWGHYVAPEQTLSSCLNAQVGDNRFANLGVDGIHPVALAGLLEHYAGGLRGHKVVLHFNPLWITSKRRDLQDPKASRFNHPKLVPQFFPRIPSYRESYGGRLNTVIARESLFLTWTAHLRNAYFQGQDVPTWTLAHPYTNPFDALAQSDPKAATDPEDQLLSWTDRGLTQERFSWVPIGESLQWAFFKRSVRILEDRYNQIFVLVGPFNEHMLTEDNRQKYKDLLQSIKTWLDDNRVNHIILPLLPSEDYADASHPLPHGYQALTQALAEDEAFDTFMGK